VPGRSPFPCFGKMLPLFAATLIMPASLFPQRMVELDPSRTRVEFTLNATLHSVHGRFQLKAGTIGFDPATGAAHGSVVVDATSGVTGNDGRDQKMHREVLESGKYPEIVFVPESVLGPPLQQGSSEVQLAGRIRLHGAEHTLSVKVPVIVTGDQLTAKLHFVVPYQQWGLKNPSTLFLRVSNKVEVDVSVSGRLLSPSMRPSQPASPP
jgi:polyisoprenoid-binding protein YceI